MICPMCDKDKVYAETYENLAWLECLDCKWTNRTYNLLELLSEKYDCEKEQEKEGDQYATAEDIFGVLELVNENRRRIVDLEKKLEYHVDTHFLRSNK